MRTQRVLFMPLGISAAVKTAILGISLVAPFPPFSRFLAPTVRYFWGELYLHYPFHLALAGRWFKQTDLLIPIFLEGLLVGITAALTQYLLLQHPSKPRHAFAETFRRYPAITLLTLIDALVLMFCIHGAITPLKLGLQKLHVWTHNFFGAAFIVAVTATIISAIVEPLFLFSVPACVIENRGWLSSLLRSFRTAGRAYRWIFFTVLAVTLCYLPILLIRAEAARLVESPWPESIFLFYLARILFSWIITTSLTVWATIYLVRFAVMPSPAASQ